MKYTIWLQILMELALSVSGEQDIERLFKKASRAFHRKLDCTHIIIYKEDGHGLTQTSISPHWAQNDDDFLRISRSLSEQCFTDEKSYCEKENKDHYYYAFTLQAYGSLCIARGMPIPIKLIKELGPIIDMFATNLLSCEIFKKQIQVEKELRKQNDYIEYLAFHDTLTTLPNRRKHLLALKECLDKQVQGAVILLDLDNFKRINDSLGHLFGDEVLKFIGRNLSKYKSDSISIFRLGGDEFLLLIEEKTKDEVEQIIKTIFNDFKKVKSIGEQKVDLTFSMGITRFPEDANNISELLMNADLALYSVKNHRKNGYRFFDTKLSKEMLHRLTITSYLREAIVSDGFKLVYQPQIDMRTGKAVGYEALLRFKYHSTPPNEFIPVAEENHMIIEIGRRVTTMAIKQLRTWLDEGREVLPIAINFSPIQIYDLSYYEFLKEELEKYQVDPSLLEIEITETVLISNKERAVEFLNRLKSLGVSFALDDYGTGYSSLYYLTFLPLDKIKLDRAIIEKFLVEELKSIISSIIFLAHNLQFTVVAEGIETKEQYEILQTLDCDILQGYFFSKPKEVEEIEKNFTMNYIEQI